MTRQRFDSSAARTLRRDIFAHMLATRGSKYRVWLMCMNLGTRFFLYDARRVEIMKSIYAALRRADDVADGDFESVPAYARTSEEYVVRLADFVEKNGEYPKNETEWLLAYAFTLAEEIGVNIREDVQRILSSLRFDARRRAAVQGHGLQVFSRDELGVYFHDMDIEGTIGACLKLSQENDKGIFPTHLKALGDASRIQLTLKDLKEDVCAGLWNVPAEDVQRLRMDLPDDLQAASVELWYKTEAVQRWCAEEINRGLRLINHHRWLMGERPLINLNWRTKNVLYLMYELPARRRLERILNANGYLGPISFEAAP